VAIDISSGLIQYIDTFISLYQFFDDIIYKFSVENAKKLFISS